MPCDGAGSWVPWHLLRRPRWDDLPVVVFFAYLAAAVPVVLLRLGDVQWFLRDEWVLITEAPDVGDELFAPFGAHWVTLPRLAYAAGWQVFGIRDYWPYQALNLALHLAVVALVWVVMRRAQVSPWLAGAAASILVLFGPGSQNITWAFQMTLNGSLVLGLAHLVLADHDGPWDRRDGLGIACGLLGLMCSGLGVTLVAVVALAVLVRRGWRPALAHAVPLLGAYLVWSTLADAQTSSPFGRPSVGQALGWVGTGLEGALAAVAAHRPLEVVFGAVIAVGLGLAWGPWRGAELAAARARLAAPTALLAGAVAFVAITTWGRWRPGPDDLIVSSRYLYVVAALGLPALGVGAAELARRWRPALPLLVVCLLVPVPANLDGFESPIFGRAFFRDETRVVTTAPRLPFARDVPRDVVVISEPLVGGQVTIGFLLDALDEGRLTPSGEPLTSAVEDEFRVRLGLRRTTPELGLPVGCAERPAPFDLTLDEGQQLLITEDVGIAFLRDGQTTSREVVFGVAGGRSLEAVLPGLRLRVVPRDGSDAMVLCGDL